MKNEDKIEKLSAVFSSFGISLSIVTLVGLLFQGSQFLPLLMAGGSVVLTPGVYFGFKKIAEVSKKNENRELREAERLITICHEEMQVKDKTIGRFTTNFLFKLKEIEPKTKFSSTDELYFQINDFLYLINSNYYETISKVFSNMSREELIDKIINQIKIYLEKNQLEELSSEDFAAILSHCYFIKDDIKKQIAKEFKDSEFFMAGRICHDIKNHHEDILNQEGYQSKWKEELSETYNFDITSEDHLSYIIQGILSVDDYLVNQTTNLASITWDMEALKTVLTLIGVEHRTDLISKKQDISSFDLAGSYIYNTLCYAALNHRESIGPIELLRTLKEWEYLPFLLRNQIATELISTWNLDIKSNPFYKTYQQKPTKIYSLSDYQNKKSKLH